MNHQIQITPPGYTSFTARLVHKMLRRPLERSWSETATEALGCIDADGVDVVEHVMLEMDHVRGAYPVRALLGTALVAHWEANELFARLRLPPC